MSNSCSLNRDVNSAQSAHFRTGRLRKPNTKPKKGGDKSAVAGVKSVRQLGCVSLDAEPPESVTISRKGTQFLGPIRRVRFSRAALRQANIRESKGPSLNKNTSPCAMKYEDRSAEETERQERRSHSDAWRLAKIFHKLKETAKATFFSPSDERFCQSHPQESRRNESLWCTWSAGQTVPLPNWKP